MFPNRKPRHPSRKPLPYVEQYPQSGFHIVIAVIVSCLPKSTAQNGWRSVLVHEHPPWYQLPFVLPSRARLGTPHCSVDECQAVQTGAAGQTEEVGKTLSVWGKLSSVW